MESSVSVVISARWFARLEQLPRPVSGFIRSEMQKNKKFILHFKKESVTISNDKYAN